MPVAQGGPTPARQAIFIGLGALLGLLAVVFLVTRLDQLGGDEDATVQVGDPIFSVGAAADVAEAIEVQGPFLVQDPASGDRDLWIHHLGSNPERDWVAFAVRQQDAPRDCFANWNGDDETFVDTCDGTVYPTNGEGLEQYAVSVDDEGALTINLNALD